MRFRLGGIWRNKYQVDAQLFRQFSGGGAFLISPISYTIRISNSLPIALAILFRNSSVGL
jgi:hypothetical protein